jgi:hypothetical protein
MSARIRLFLCLACVVVGAIEAPRAMHVLAEDLGGPYGAHAPTTFVAERGSNISERGSSVAERSSSVAVSRTPAVLVWADPAQEEEDAFDSDAAFVARGDRR